SGVRRKGPISRDHQGRPPGRQRGVRRTRQADALPDGAGGALSGEDARQRTGSLGQVSGRQTRIRSVVITNLIIVIARKSGRSSSPETLIWAHDVPTTDRGYWMPAFAGHDTAE